MQMEKPSHCLVSVSLSLHQVRMTTEANNDNILRLFTVLQLWNSQSDTLPFVQMSDLSELEKSDMYWIGMLKKGSETEHRDDMKPLNVET